MGKIVLITGGARSGKSTFAEQYAAKLSDKVAYIATSQILDKEMDYRVKLHKKRRPENWTTLEAPFNAHRALAKALTTHKVVLFDCLTLYLSNYLCDPVNTNFTIDEFTQGYKKLLKKLIEVAEISQGTVIFVTNEVGAGIVPESSLARKYRDLAGIGNQMMAAAAREVYLVVAGIPMVLKKEQAE